MFLICVRCKSDALSNVKYALNLTEYHVTITVNQAVKSMEGYCDTENTAGPSLVPSCSEVRV